MKKFMKSASWQIGAFVLAIGAAFATNAMKDTTLFTTVQGYQKINLAATDCEPRMLCSTEIGPACQWKDASNKTHNLFELAPSGGVTKCVNALYQIPEN